MERKHEGPTEFFAGRRGRVEFLESQKGRKRRYSADGGITWASSRTRAIEAAKRH